VISPIEKRLQASINMDAFNGDSFERSICAKQAMEAVSSIEALKYDLHGLGLEVIDLKAEIERLRGLVLMGEAVVEDFLPNIGNCCLQDYGRLNEFLIATTALKAQEQG